jgi:hypothetical protein
LVKGSRGAMKCSREEKLTVYLNSKGIHKYKSGNEKFEITTEVMGKNTKARNVIFHSGSTSISELLYTHVFPIVQKILNLEMRKTL